MRLKLIIIFVSVPYIYADSNSSFNEYILSIFDNPTSEDKLNNSNSNLDSNSDLFSIFDVPSNNDSKSPANEEDSDDFDYLLGIFNTSTPVETTTELIDDEIPFVLKEFNSKELPDRSICGVQSFEDRIFGGEETGIDEFPWMAALEYKNAKSGELIGVRCGGSIINNRFVLTAAHCLSYPGFELIQVRLGEWNLTSDPDCPDCKPVQIVKVAKRIPHPYYGGLTKNNDIALLLLEENVTFNDVIRPICLPPPNLPPPKTGTLLTVAGWGLTEHGYAQSEVKLKVKLPLISNEECEKALKDETVQSSQICAGGDLKKDACQGDSGGPLVRRFFDEFQGRLQWYQEAVVSRGLACGVLGYPGIYTRVSRYMSWILYNVETQ